MLDIIIITVLKMFTKENMYTNMNITPTMYTCHYYRL